MTAFGETSIGDKPTTQVSIADKAGMAGSRFKSRFSQSSSFPSCLEQLIDKDAYLIVQRCASAKSHVSVNASFNMFGEFLFVGVHEQQL
ncbi:hypothetical protein [Roseibium sp. MMSF_3544]|uniref:hypothetical protein n=1 Tax=unclassified Roseibium TaxID=2629323 RepID=UPI00273E0F41|nr:hypothetical protein [Roseibium sp. MMSF_3544]